MHLFGNLDHAIIYSMPSLDINNSGDGNNSTDNNKNDTDNNNNNNRNSNHFNDLYNPIKLANRS